MKHFVAGCYSFDNSDEMSMEVSGNGLLTIYSLRRIKKNRNNHLSKLSLFLKENTSKNQSKKIHITTLDENETVKFPNFHIPSSQIVNFSKEGSDDIQIFFTTDSQNLRLTKIGEKSFSNGDDKNVSNFAKIDKNLFNSIITELRRAAKSAQPLHLMLLILQSYFPEPFFSNPMKLSKSYLEKFLTICFNRSNSDIFYEFSKLIEFITLSLHFGSELSLGAGYFVLSFLNFYKRETPALLKLIYANRKMVTFLALFTFLDDAVNHIPDLISSGLVECDLTDDIPSFTLYRFIANNPVCFHYTYKKLFSNIVSQEELKLFSYNRIIGVFDWERSMKVTKPHFEMSPSISCECKVSPFANAFIHEKKKNLKVEMISEFEQNEQNFCQLKNCCSLTMRLSQPIRQMKSFLLYIPPIENQDLKLIHILIPIFCLIVSFLVMWEFSNR
ncbi:hypothetical protein TRFO_03586 [Tritrichomonas foetus]|uniref:Uncharacterized protein n=1 Tax=Tritrichomonas foetus TaxID=1144522 RepID=A0A1J4KRY5_9EUKA|nr:hypothetical protein TRFO_03586 [Tritrichomonas foetus]|eukprot:OHT12580.1 hypothetical protein TRFO_03586 [Tritrichomonas foetus]